MDTKRGSIKRVSERLQQGTAGAAGDQEAGMNQEERIKALEAEIDRLTDSLEEEKEAVAALTEPHKPAMKRIVELEAENAALREDKARLDERLNSAKRLQQLTLDNEVRWMRKHSELLALIDSLRDWKSPDAVLQVKDLRWFKELEHQIDAARKGRDDEA